MSDGNSRVLPVLLGTISRREANLPSSWLDRGSFSVDKYLCVMAADPTSSLQLADLIVAVDGKPPPKSLSFKAKTVSFIIVRGGEEMRIEVPTRAASEFDRTWYASCFGMILQQPPPELPITMRDVPQGLHICRIQSGSPAKGWDIYESGFLLSINNQKISGKDDLEKVISNLPHLTEGK
ncbi:hypothetical protein QBC46DRAFT_449083 [Diplogelasinospora grovesii]|uniref:PDZ domain-containing protein n=1 Tax=Diplogelasinospora grovesii TaxID=303347 RepID=A0AAN6N980_9PEZI|nr:hypothetical protein QBC46DRAFT_449083 [Diplogelasinospora grovesii]